MSEYKQVETTQTEQGREGRITTFKITQLIWLLLAFLEAVICFRFIFKLIGVNAANPFASFIYGLTNIFVAPFASLTGAPAAQGMVFEFSTIIAMIVYGLVGWGIERIVYVSFYRPRGAITASQTTVTDHTGTQPPDSV